MENEEKLEIFINPSSGVPIYIQIADAIRYAIVAGILKEGEKVPPVRDIAYQLTTNPNTVAKAYQKLIHEGLLEVKRGVGTFVSNTKKDSENTETEKLRRIIRELVKEARNQGIPMNKFEEMIKEEINRWNTQLK